MLRHTKMHTCTLTQRSLKTAKKIDMKDGKFDGYAYPDVMTYSTLQNKFWGSR